MISSRWLAWTRSQEIERMPEPEPTKPTKPNFVSFVSTPPGSFQKIEAVEHILRTKVFPHCPKCASYALYRQNNIGNYECQTSGLLDIPEEVARRLQ